MREYDNQAKIVRQLCRYIETHCPEEKLDDIRKTINKAFSRRLQKAHDRNLRSRNKDTMSRVQGKQVRDNS